MRIEDRRRLLVIVLAAGVARAFTLWVGRAEFTGWLNHTYYYYVQVRGLLADGALPYPDMPLLFYFYALLAKAFTLFGVDLEDSIVASTRLVMCATPALVAVPVYGLVRRMNGPDPIRRGQWLLLSLSAFLPLSLGYLPEFLQKNTAGLLLLAWLLLSCRRFLESRDWRSAAAVAILLPAITLTHFGTFGAALFYGIALAAALATERGIRRRHLAAGLVWVASGGLAIALIHAFDPQRLDRLLGYVADSMQASLVVAAIQGGHGLRPLLSLAMIGAFYGLLYGIHRVGRRQMRDCDSAARVFWLANLLFAGLLVLPLLDQLLMGRLAIFVSLPLLLAILQLERLALDRPRLRVAGIALVTSAWLLMAAGELVSSRIHNRNHQAILEDIVALRSSLALSATDLIVTRTGAEHVCNWFFGTKAGVITSLKLADFKTYERVYVLNPKPEAADSDGIESRVALDENDRYWFMRRNIPRPAGVEPLFVSDHLEFFALASPPLNWYFGDNGEWLGYSRP